MEIPYTVTARKDTGLFNSKVGIWLFLASEVMLFGGLFSGYVFLRIYSDYPWPERALPVLPGLINTFVLIGSSVTVVFAWASLKMRQWRRFQVFMAITVACAGIFMVLKGIEYKAKWGHQAVRMDDFTIIEGHTHEAKLDDEGQIKVLHGHGEHGDFWANTLNFKTDAVSFSLVRAHEPWVDSILKQTGERKAKVVAKKPDASKGIFLYGHIDDYESDPAARAKAEEQLVTDYATAKEKQGRAFGKNSVYIPAGTPLSYALLERAREIFIEGRAHNAKVRTRLLRSKWETVHAANPGVHNSKLSNLVKIEEADTLGKVVPLNSSLTFAVEPSAPLILKRSWIKRDVPPKSETADLRDDTSLSGELQDSPLALAVDAIDFRWVAQKAKEANKDPMAVIEKSWIFSEKNEHAKDFKRVWSMHKTHLKHLEEHLLEKYGTERATGKPKRVPTDTERYRITWKELVQYARAKKEGVDPDDQEQFDALKPGMTEGFAGPNHYKEEYEKLHPFLELEIPHEKVSLESKFTPKWNTYYAVYFTLTGLHGLHVIGGAIVLSYYLFFSKGLYRRNPEWLANRVEVGGLFWHFVDLVWIFLFPILYLM